jgi:hypothetical protein
MYDTDNVTIPGGIKLFFEQGFDGNTGYRDLGNLVTSDIESAIETLEHFTNRGGSRTKDKEALLSSAIAINFTFDEPNAHNLAWFFLGGTKSSVAAGSVAISREILKLTGTDAVPVALPMATSHSTVVQSIASSPVTYTGGTNPDYVVNQANGTVARTGGSTITDGEEVMVSYNSQIPAHKSFPVLTAPIIEGKGRMLLLPTSGVRMVWEFPKCSIKPNGSMSLDDQEWMQGPMALNILADTTNNPSAPFGTLRTWTVAS